MSSVSTSLSKRCQVTQCTTSSITFFSLLNCRSKFPRLSLDRCLYSNCMIHRTKCLSFFQEICCSGLCGRQPFRNQQKKTSVLKFRRFLPLCSSDDRSLVLDCFVSCDFSKESVGNGNGNRNRSRCRQGIPARPERGAHTPRQRKRAQASRLLSAQGDNLPCSFGFMSGRVKLTVPSALGTADG